MSREEIERDEGYKISRELCNFYYRDFPESEYLADNTEEDSTNNKIYHYLNIVKSMQSQNEKGEIFYSSYFKGIIGIGLKYNESKKENEIYKLIIRIGGDLEFRKLLEEGFSRSCFEKPTFNFEYVEFTYVSGVGWSMKPYS